jgi:hypothetical protein
MKTPLLSVFIVLFSLAASAQVIAPTMKASFGVDGDLKARSFNGNTQTGDDWYIYPGAAGNDNNGTIVIDTTGAASIVAGYATDVSPWIKRSASLFRGMSRPAFSVVNNRLWLDALFVRDYHGTDTTVFVLASKNGQSPADWTADIQSIPDKNDILDMFMHIRRNGPTTTDSLWMFGGLSIENTQGNRYFDFEMYQTDIYYDRPSRNWFGYGPDAGHTSWQFDAAGNVTRPGDIIFSAGFQSGAAVSYIEARIWIDSTSIRLIPNPAQFKWSGSFDGATSGAQYGYAGILPKTAGDFYIMTQSGNGEWPGPFGLVIGSNSLQANYTSKQFMEFSVNLTKLGLDPVTTFGGDVCGTPFNRLVVKTRTSEAFTSSLKDFVAPTDLFLAPRAEALADVPLFCGSLENASELEVLNPSLSSVYTWTTTDGNFVGSTTGTVVQVDAPGTYVVTQRLSAGCNVYATDTVTIVYDEDCTVLKDFKITFSGNLRSSVPVLNWTSFNNNHVNYYELQRSEDGQNFYSLGRIENSNTENPIQNYIYTDNEAGTNRTVYYRLKMISSTGITYSRIINMQLAINKNFSLTPNPAVNYTRLSLSLEKAEQVRLFVYKVSGELIFTNNYSLASGANTISLQDLNRWQPGMYMIRINSASINQWQKLIITK